MIIPVFVTFSKNVSAEVSYRMRLIKGKYQTIQQHIRRPRFSFFIFNCQKTETHEVFLRTRCNKPKLTAYQFKVGFRSRDAFPG